MWNDVTEQMISGLSSQDKKLLMRLIANLCEKSFRRGFQQGWDSSQRRDKVCDLIAWRFDTSLSVSVSPHGTYHCTSLERLKIECHGLHRFGLQKMEETYLKPHDIETSIAPLFPAVRRKAGIRKSVRFSVLKRDGFRCRYCGANASEQKLHVDHVKPRSLGGSDDMENLVAACEACNLGKSNRHADLASDSTHGI